MYTIEHIQKSYGKKVILDDITISVNEGEAVGILGVNGSGKSTLLNYIASYYAKEDPSVVCGYVPQENPLFDELKPLDNLRMWTKLPKDKILEELASPRLSLLGITDFLDKPVKKLSGGMKKRLSLASVLISSPKLLLMDEPFAALDLPAKQDILHFMRTYLSYGNSLIIASHEENIFHFCNRVFLLKDGKFVDTAGLAEKGISYVDILRGTP